MCREEEEGGGGKMAEIVTSAAELSKLLAEERSKNRILAQQLEVERSERYKIEQLLSRLGEREAPLRGSDSGSSTNGLAAAGEGAGGGGGGSSSGVGVAGSGGSVNGSERKSREQRQLAKQLRETEAQLKEMKKQMEFMQLERESVAQRVETEEDSLSNNLLRKLRAVQKEKETLQLELSRSSRSSSLDHSVDSSVAGSLASESLHAETRSELSGISNLACSSAMSDPGGENFRHSRKKQLPPPPAVVGEK